MCVSESGCRRCVHARLEDWESEERAHTHLRVNGRPEPQNRENKKAPAPRSARANTQHISTTPITSSVGISRVESVAPAGTRWRTETEKERAACDSHAAPAAGRRPAGIARRRRRREGGLARHAGVGPAPYPASPSRARVLEARLVIQSTAQPPPSRLSLPLFSPWTDTGRRDSRLSPLRPLSPPPLLPPQGMPPSRRRGVTAVALMAVAAGMVEAGCPFGEKRTGQGERETPATAPLHLSRALSLTSLSPSLSLPSSRPRPARHPGLLLGPLPLRRRLPLPPGGLPLLRARPHGGALRRPRAPL